MKEYMFTVKDAEYRTLANIIELDFIDDNMAWMILRGMVDSALEALYGEPETHIGIVKYCDMKTTGEWFLTRKVDENDNEEWILTKDGETFDGTRWDEYLSGWL